ncbi:MAG TPA: alpha/beta hydrolase [Casimicrobiaceae bacterium]|nr:alpha/beta hydrolase [Casimicrobiaceae bacterium]
MLRLTVKRNAAGGRSIPEMRARQARMDERFGRIDPRTCRTAVECFGVRAEWIDVPETRPERVLLYLHGGAFAFRFPKIHAGMVARWCRQLGARALMVDYRLAPEHPYPAAADDCHAAYRWLLAQGHEPHEIVIAGDSAGANLALATLHRIKAAGELQPACAVLLAPVVDFTLSGRSLVTNAGCDAMLSLSDLVAFRALYSPPERYLDPSVSPLFGDFTGLPPLLFQTGSHEMAVDESKRAAAKAHASGVKVELEIWHRMPHVFQAIASLPQAAQAAEHVGRFVATYAGWRSVPA